MLNSASYYRSIASRYDSFRQWGDTVASKVVKVGEISRGTRVLDIGCGTGNLISAVKNISGCNAYGIDLSLEMLDVAKKKIANGIFVKGNVGAIPFANCSFNCVIGAFFLHLVDRGDREIVIKECYRVLSRGRLLILTLSYEQIEKSIYGRFFPEIIGIEKNGRFSDITEIENWLWNSGFTQVKCETIQDEPIKIDEQFFSSVKNKAISSLALISPQAYVRGLRRLRRFLDEKGDEERICDQPITLVYGEKQL